MPRVATSGKGSRERSSAVRKALKIIEAVVESRSPVTMSAIERATGLPRPTAHRVTTGLIDAGYVERDPSQRGHTPGPRLVRLAYDLLRNGTARGRRIDILKQLSQETGEASHFAVLRGPVVHLLDQVASPSPLGVNYDGVDSVPLHCTACGKLLLSLLPDAQRNSLLAGYQLARHTASTIVDRKRLVLNLSDMRQAGVCIEEGEHVVGVCTMALPVMSRSGALTGAVGLAVPSVRFGAGESKKLLPPLRQAATQLSAVFD